MKYTVETTETGCVETLELDDGKKYTKRSTRTSTGVKHDDDDFYYQLSGDGITDDGILDAVNDLLDGFFAIDFVEMAEYF